MTLAVISGGTAISAHELSALAAQATEDLHIRRGHVLGLEPQRTVQHVAALYAAARHRAPLALLPSGPAETNRELRRRIPDRMQDDVAALLFTSGSTSEPKLVALARSAFIAQAEASAQILGWRDDDRWLLDLPLFHIGGLSVLSRCLRAKGTVVLSDRKHFDAQATAAQIERDRVTLLSWVPTMLERMLDSDWSPPTRLRWLILGGAPASPELLRRARDRGLPVITSYGMTETCSHIALDGKAIADAEIEVRDGRIWVRGPMVMNGYVGADCGAFDDEGWFATSDAGHFEGERLIVTDRIDDVIVTGGEKVSPTAVERALCTLPGIRAACVFAQPNSTWGQQVAAAVVGDGRAQDWVRELRTRLPRHQIPRQIAVVDCLPLLASGKPDRRLAALRAQHQLIDVD